MKNLLRADINMPELNENGVYNNGDVAIFTDLSDIQSRTYVSDLYAVVLCTAGKGSVMIDGTLREIRPNDLMVCSPNVIIEKAMMSVDFQCCCFVMRVGFIEKIIPRVDNVWDFHLLFEKSILTHLTSDEASVFILYFNLILSRVNHCSERSLKHVVNSLLVAFMYDFRDTVKSGNIPESHPQTSRETHFKAFIELLSGSYPKSRSVQYYADRLCITPKYLSTICKSIGGRSASKFISQYVAADIEYQLRHTDKPIKTISLEMGFPNISFFGKYVKNLFGKSPKAIRESVGE